MSPSLASRLAFCFASILAVSAASIPPAPPAPAAPVTPTVVTRTTTTSNSCSAGYTCGAASASNNGVLTPLRIPVAVKVGAQLFGQGATVIVCSYTTFSASLTPFGENTCVYVGTTGLITTNTNVNINVFGQGGFSCPTSLNCGSAPVATASSSPAKPVQTCGRNTCPTGSTSRSDFYINAPSIQFGTTSIGGLSNVNSFACTYTATPTNVVSAIFSGLNGILGGSSTTCLYTVSGNVVTSAGTQVGNSLLSGLGDFVFSLGGLFGGSLLPSFNCPAPPPTTCTTASTLSRRLDSPNVDYAKEKANLAVQTRQFNRRLADVDAPTSAGRSFRSR